MCMFEHRVQILPDDDRQRRLAGDAILSAEPMSVPDVPALLTELDDLRIAGR